jgi:hypothetical protein
MRMSILASTFLFLTTNALAQNGGGISADGLAGIRWQINRLLGLDTTVSAYTLQPYSEEMFRWGNAVTFSDNGMGFRSGNSAKCGNDCFISVTGQYRIENQNILIIKIDDTTFSDYCPNRINGTGIGATMRFEMTFRSDTLLLTKVES